METVKVYLSRRNLLALLSKLDRVKKGDSSACTIVKMDTQNEKFPMTVPVVVTAVEDADYYHDRAPGPVHEADEKGIISQQTSPQPKYPWEH